MIEVELPDGSIAEFPDNMSSQEISSVLSKQFARQETKDISRPYAALQTFTQGGTFGFGDEIQAAIGAGMAALPKSLGGAALPFSEGYQQALEMGREELSAAREQYPAQSFLTEVGGGLATGTAGAKALGALAPRSMSTLQNLARTRPLTTATAAGAGSGALYGAGSAEGDRLEGAGSGAVLGGLGGYVGGYIASKAAPRLGELGQRILGKTQDDVQELAVKTNSNITGSIDDVAGATTEPQAVRGALGNLTAEQQARSNILAQAGVPKSQQTAGMVTRDPKVWQFEQNIKGIQDVGDEIRQRYVNVNSLIKSKLDDIGAGLGGKAKTAYEAGESVTESVVKKSREMQDEIGGLYSQIRDEVGDDIGMTPKSILSTIDEASDNAYADKIVNSMTRKMQRYGVIDKDLNPTGETLSVKNAEELRKFANSLRGDKQTDHIVANVIDSLDDDVIDTAGVDAFAQARDKARLRFKEFESKLLKNITQEKLVSDDVLRRVAFQGKVKDIQALKQSLLSGSEKQIERGTKAWSDLKLQTLQEIIDKSTTAGGKLQGSSFARNLDKVGSERLNVLFDAEELANLDLIRQALEFTTVEVPESVVNYSGTGAANANNALQGIIKNSKLADIIQSTADVVNRIPVVGAISSPVTGLGSLGAQQMQRAAQRQSIQNVMNPQRSLGQLQIDPRLTGSIGIGSGVLSAQEQP